MTGLEVQVSVVAPKWKHYHAAFSRLSRRACLATLSRHPVISSSCHLSCVLTDDAHIRALNAQFRGKDKPTNVLSFSNSLPRRGRVREGADLLDINALTRSNNAPLPTSPLWGEEYLGDIVLSADTIKREADEQEKSFSDHLTHLIVHGTLHLLGHDHEEAALAQRMEKLEISILSKLGIANPYEIR